MTATTAAPASVDVAVTLSRDGKRITVQVTGEQYGPLAVTPAVEVTPDGAVRNTGWWQVTHRRTGLAVPTPVPLSRPGARWLAEKLAAEDVDWSVFDAQPSTPEAWERCASAPVREQVLWLAITAGVEYGGGPR